MDGKEVNVNSIVSCEWKGFARAHRALYITSPSWDPNKGSPTFHITGHVSLVIGHSPYRPVPYADFVSALLKLQELGAVEVKPSFLRERFESHWLQDNLDDLTATHLICNNTYLRFRKGSEEYGDKTAHGLIVLGSIDSVIQLTKRISLPHPFDNERIHIEIFLSTRATIHSQY